MKNKLHYLVGIKDDLDLEYFGKKIAKIHHCKQQVNRRIKLMNSYGIKNEDIVIKTF